MSPEHQTSTDQSHQPLLRPYTFTEIHRVSLFGGDNSNPKKFLDESRPALNDEMIIAESMGYRQLPFKTQVVSGLVNSSISNRGSHSSNIETNSLVVGQKLNLNEDLIRAIAKSHDIGQGPFSHLFEDISKKELGIKFDHKIFSVILATCVENNGHGLDLTYETLVGILAHTFESRKSKNGALSLTDFLNEQNLIMYFDKISYLFCDICDFEKMGDEVLTPEVSTYIDSLFPKDDLNPNNPEANKFKRIHQCTQALIKESQDKGYISFEDCQEAKNIKDLRKYMLNIYEDNRRFQRPHFSELISKFFNNFDRIDGLAEYDPLIIGAQLTDQELVKVVSGFKKLHEPGRIKLECFDGTMVQSRIKNGYLEGQKYTDLTARLAPKFPQFKL